MDVSPVSDKLLKKLVILQIHTANGGKTDV